MGVIVNGVNAVRGRVAEEAAHWFPESQDWGINPDLHLPEETKPCPTITYPE